MAVREIKISRTGRPTLEGAGVHLSRAFGNGDEIEFDPFLMLDDFRNDDPEMYQRGFPWHPHRGIETITYVIEGEVDHGDSLGNEGTIGVGDVQWMTAGSGIIHQEMPRGDRRGRMGGFQLWLNLPAAAKMTEPRYQGVESAQIPLVEQDGAWVRVIAGTVGGVTGPVADVFADPEYLDVMLRPGAVWEHPVPAGHTVFAYHYQGDASFAREEHSAAAGRGRVVLFGDGDSVKVAAGDDGAGLLLASGRPLREPIAWRGPIVMNTLEELDGAWLELQAGTFVKHGKPPLGGGPPA